MERWQEGLKAKPPLCCWVLAALPLLPWEEPLLDSHGKGCYFATKYQTSALRKHKYLGFVHCLFLVPLLLTSWKQTFPSCLLPFPRETRLHT